MSDRPIGPILAAIAAMMFVVAFSAAAVMRPDSAADPADGAAARTAPAAAQENTRLATIVSPAFSRVAALPALHLPKAKPRKAKKSRPAKPKVSPPARSAPAAPPTPAATPAPPVATAAPPVQRTAPAPAPPRPTRPSTPNVGDTFDSEG